MVGFSRWNDNREIARAGDILEDKTIDFANVLPLYYRPLGYSHRPLCLVVAQGPVAVGSLGAGIDFTGPNFPTLQNDDDFIIGDIFPD